MKLRNSGRGETPLRNYEYRTLDETARKGAKELDVLVLGRRGSVTKNNE
jgi:hypothetical protein